MHAHLSSARLAPKKADLIAKMVRGKTVPDAIELLRTTHKKGARLVEGVLKSAVANASHNFKQDAQTMVLKEIKVNQGTAYRRGTPMARGRVRPIKKFLCHISITLGYPEAPKAKKETNPATSRGASATKEKSAPKSSK